MMPTIDIRRTLRRCLQATHRAPRSWIGVRQQVAEAMNNAKPLSTHPIYEEWTRVRECINRTDKLAEALLIADAEAQMLESALMDSIKSQERFMVETCGVDPADAHLKSCTDTGAVIIDRTQLPEWTYWRTSAPDTAADAAGGLL